MARVWRTKLYKQSRRLTQKRTFFISGLALAALPIAAVALTSHNDNQPANAVVSVEESGTTSTTDSNSTEQATPAAEAGSATNTSSTTVTINGQDVPIPESGVIDQTMPSGDGGSSHVRVETTPPSESSSDNSSDVHMNISVESNSNAGEDGDTHERSRTRIRVRSND